MEERTEDYISLEELYHKEEATKPKNQNPLSPFMMFGKASFIVFKAIWFGLSTILKGIYNGLIKLNEVLDKAQKSKQGQAMMKKYKEENTGFGFKMQPPQKHSKKQKGLFGG